MHGDFHNLVFADNSVDVVFTNSLDHAFKLEWVIKEIQRVLKHKGYLVIEIMNGTKDKYYPGRYESMYWEHIDDIVKILRANKFEVIKRFDIKYPWKGQHIILQRR